MPTMIDCENLDCIHCKLTGCDLANVTISHIYDYGCSEYESYLDTPEYQNEFFKAVKACDGKPAKAKAKGKKIESDGYIFYTEDMCDDTDDYITVTEERTGCNCGYLHDLRNKPGRWERFEQLYPNTPSCADLPLVVYNEKTHKYEYVEKQTSGEGDANGD